MPTSPSTSQIESTGYKRSPSVTAAVDFFEQRARSASGTSLVEQARTAGSPRGSPRPSVSAEAGPGPSSQTTSPRLRGNGLPRGSARGRSVISPHIGGDRSGRSSVDSNASSTTRPPIGLGVRGVGGTELGSRRLSETATTSPGSAAVPSRIRQPRPSLPTSSLSTGSVRQVSQGMRREGTSSSQEAGPSRLTPRNSPARANVPLKTPSPRTSPTAKLTSPSRTPMSRIPTRTTQKTTPTRTTPSHSPAATRSPRPSAPTFSVSHPTPDKSRIPRPSAGHSTPPSASLSRSRSSQSNGIGTRRTSYRLSESVGSHSSKHSSATSSGSRSGRTSPSRNEVVLDSDAEKDLPPLPASNGPPLIIPKRTSSAQSPDLPSSPIMNSPTKQQGGPLITPRGSSKQLMEDVDFSQSSAKQHIVLGEISPTSRPRPRLSPNLSIDPPPALAAMRTLSASARPSPPIPAKSPLRSLSHADSTHSSRVSSRVVSRDSTFDSTTDVDEPTTTTDSTAATDDSTQAVVGLSEYVARHYRPRQDVDMTPQSSQLELEDDSRDSQKRLTTMTYMSMYSQDSRPSSATVDTREFGMLPDVEGNGTERRIRRQSRMDDLWGRSSRSQSQSDKSPASETFNSARMVAPLTIISNDQTDSPDSSAMNTATTTSDVSKDAITGHSPHQLNVDMPPRPVRSPSAPMLKDLGRGMTQPSSKAARLLGIDEKTPRSNIPAPLLPSAMTRSPTAPVISPRTPSSVTSKRTHLIREIAHTERAFATDLALVRDAYLGQYLRPNSISSGGETTSGSSRRGSATTTTTENKRLSGTDWSLPTPPPVSPFPRSPSEGANGQGYFGLSNLATNPSMSSLKQPSPNTSSRPSLGTPALSMGPPVGKPLSPADARTVFLNLEQLASGAEDMARGFEGAMGEEEAGASFAAREGDVGSDRLGEVFMALIPRLRPMYHYYCSRQESASSRLQELLADPSTAAHLNGCWSSIKSHTHAWNLDSMLIKPVQRITKYPLLFEDLLACTTPVHPDYFNIRSAAEMARSIAMEIDEAKRRKDVVASAISTKKPKTPKMTKTTLPSPAKDKKGLKMFRKEKMPPGTTTSSASTTTMSLPMSTSSSNLALDPPPEISKTSFGLLKDLTMRVEEADQVVRRVGKEVVIWTAGSKEMILAEGGMMSTWMRVVRLDAEHAAEDRIGALRKVLEAVVKDEWAVLNEQVRDQVMPIFSKLLETVTNPRKVIAKHSSKQPDYIRYIQLLRAKKPIERTLLLSARDFYALHSQLMDELPIFLDGYMRILDLALVSFASAQARYYEGVKIRLDEFAQRWIARPRKSPRISVEVRRPSGEGDEDAGGMDVDGEGDLKTGRGIVKAWHEAWAPYADALENFQCTRPAKAMVARIASFNARPGSRPSSRPPSRVSSPAGARPGLQHSASFTARSRESSSGSSQISAATSSNSHARSRSASMLAPVPPPLPSPIKESRFNPFRNGSKTPKSAQATPRTSRPSSLHIPGTVPAENRYSFGLPKIDQVGGLDGLGKLGVSPTNRLRMSPGERMIALGGKPETVLEEGMAGMRIASDPVHYVSEEAEDDSPSMGRGGTPRDTAGDRMVSVSSEVGSSGVPFPAAPPRRRSSGAMAGLGLGDVESHTVDSSRRPSGRSVLSNHSAYSATSIEDNTRERTDRGGSGKGKARAFPAPPPSAFPTSVSAGAISAALSATTGMGTRSSSSGAGGYVTASDVTPAREKRQGSVATGTSRDGRSSAATSGYDMDASEGWRGEAVLYQCGCVADFDPFEIGDKRYRGLRFLPMAQGDLFDIFHEVGRIDELPKFPYPEVGVDNDGVLVGQAEDGAIGLLICSFLEPLRE